MQQWKSVDEVLDFAIGQEEKSIELYTDIAGRMEKPWMRQLFEDFAREEAGHKQKLLEIKAGKLLEPVSEKVLDLKIGDYLVQEESLEEFDYQQALILAMKKEKVAFKIYTDLAGKAEDENLRNIFSMLAQEEAKHKLRFEIEYDEYVLRDN